MSDGIVIKGESRVFQLSGTGTHTLIDFEHVEDVGNFTDYTYFGNSRDVIVTHEVFSVVEIVVGPISGNNAGHHSLVEIVRTDDGPENVLRLFDIADETRSGGSFYCSVKSGQKIIARLNRHMPTSTTITVTRITEIET